MLQTQKPKAPIKVVLKVAMIVDGERHDRGDVVEISYREFVYLSNFDRVAEATKDNVAEVAALVKAEKDAAKPAAK